MEDPDKGNKPGASPANEDINDPSNPCGETKSVPLENGRYINPWKGRFYMPNKLHILRFLLWERDNSQVPKEEEVLKRELPVEKPDLEKLKSPPESGICATWIGHSTVLVQFDGITVLTDPIFSDKQMFGPKRYRPIPCNIDELPQIDAVVISHNHPDHLDTNSVYKLNDRFGDKLTWYVPIGLAGWMKDSRCNNVIELDWWQENSLKDHSDVKFVFTPTQHWSNRGLFDVNKVLWGSWSVIGPKNRFFFAGDTGMCPAFKQIGHKYGPFDLAAIPIGAYEPRWFMKHQHINPEEAVTIHQDVKAKKSVGIHWGTFKLTYEHYLEPPQKLKEAMQENNLKLEDFFVLKHGESRDVGDNEGVQ